MNRIVVIEDDPGILRGLADNLRLESYEVLTAADGENGYRLVNDSQPDMVILDLMLPRLNGLDVCRKMRCHGLATPILMLTADDQEDSRVRGFEAGADDYVSKPFSIRELLGSRIWSLAFSGIHRRHSDASAKRLMEEKTLDLRSRRPYGFNLTYRKAPLLRAPLPVR